MKWWQYILKYKLHHPLVWLALFAGWYFFRAKDFPTQQLAWQVTAIKVIVLALLIYVTNYLLIPRLLYKKKYFQFFFIYLVMIVGMGMLKLKIIMSLVYPHLEPFANFKPTLYVVQSNSAGYQRFFAIGFLSSSPQRTKNSRCSSKVQHERSCFHSDGARCV